MVRTKERSILLILFSAVLLSAVIFNTYLSTGSMEANELAAEGQPDITGYGDMCLSVNTAAGREELKPCYIDGVYYFILPSGRLNGTAYLYYTEGEKKRQARMEVALPSPEQPETELLVETETGLCCVRLACAENTSAVMVTTNRKDARAYLEESKANEVSGIVRVLDEDGNLHYAGHLARMRGRGNDSWSQSEKKGFSMKLEESTDLLQMGENTTFLLLSGNRDASLLTYKVAEDLFKEVGFAYAPENRFTNLYLDGEYLGLYFLTEKLETGAGRIAIDDGKEVSGGFLFELDNEDYGNDPYVVETDHGNHYVIHSARQLTQEQLDYGTAVWNLTEDAVMSADGLNSLGRYYTDYLDLTSLAMQELYYEIAGEYSIDQSVYYYKNSDESGDGKVYAAYPWDVEHSFTDEDTLYRLFMMDIMNRPRAASFYGELWKFRDFREEVFACWENQYKPALEKLLSDETGENPEGVSSLSFYTEKYRTSAKLNELLWGEEQDMDKKEESIRAWLKEKTQILDEQLGVY